MCAVSSILHEHLDVREQQNFQGLPPNIQILLPLSSSMLFFLNLFLLTISNLCDFEESFPKLSSHKEMKLVTLLGKGESVKVQPQ